MKTLDELERLNALVDAERARGILISNGQDYTAIRAMEALPALIRVARAAENVERILEMLVDLDAPEDRAALNEVHHALQQLRDLSEGREEDWK